MVGHAAEAGPRVVLIINEVGDIIVVVVARSSLATVVFVTATLPGCIAGSVTSSLILIRRASLRFFFTISAAALAVATTLKL